jgi:plasmid stabilization system protein ParE
MSGYELHPEAYNDLEAIREYIAEDNPTAAARVIVDIFDAIRALVPFPRKGHQRIDLSSRPLRFWRTRDYLIAMRIRSGRCGWLPSCTAAATRAFWLLF